MHFLTGTKFQDRVFIEQKATRKNILSLFKGHVKPGGVIKGATVPDLEFLETLRQTLIRT